MICSCIVIKSIRSQQKYDAAGINNLNNTVLVPFAVSDAGRYGNRARKHLKALARFAQRVGYCETWFFWSAFVPQLNATLMEGNMRMVRMARKNIMDKRRNAVGENAAPWAGGAPHWYVDDGQGEFEMEGGGDDND